MTGKLRQWHCFIKGPYRHHTNTNTI